MYFSSLKFVSEYNGINRENVEETMSSVRRIYVEKKQDYAVKAKELQEEMKKYLNLPITSVRILIRYDVENISEATYQKAIHTVFSEPPVDQYYEESFPVSKEARVFSVEYLPGQFDQRADSAQQCVKLLDEKEEPTIRSATTYIVEGPMRRIKRNQTHYLLTLKSQMMCRFLMDFNNSIKKG